MQAGAAVTLIIRRNHTARISKKNRRAWLAVGPARRFEFTFAPESTELLRLDLVEGFFSEPLPAPSSAASASRPNRNSSRIRSPASASWTVSIRSSPCAPRPVRLDEAA